MVAFPAIVVVVLAFALAASTYFIPSANMPSSSQSTTTVFQSSPLELKASTPDWAFVASIDSSNTELGQSIKLTANLTNTASSNQTIAPYVEPYVNPSVWAENGTEIWAWNPPQVNWVSMTIASGQTLSTNVIIPTTELRQGNYLIEVTPLSPRFSPPENFTLTFQLIVY